MARYSNKQNTMPKLSEFVVNNEVTQLCWDYIFTLSKVVVSKYFSKYLEYFDREDLAQLATADAVTFIKKVSLTQRDEDIRNMRNVLFTRIRNTVSNFIFRSNRLVNTEDEILDKQVVYPKSFSINADLIKMDDLSIDSIESFRDISLRVWKFFKTNTAKRKYFINDTNNSIDDWKSYSEVHNMRSPCDLINSYDKYTDDQIEALADKLDSVTGQNYFYILYQLLGDKFLAFLDVFQEDKFNIPSTALVKRLLTDMSIYEDYDKGLDIDALSDKYCKSHKVIQRVIKSRGVV